MMSYDLMVFEKTQAPVEKEAFMEWYDKQTEWSEPHGYQSSAHTSAALQQWYNDIIIQFPNMNAVDDELLDEDEDEDDEFESRLSDYSIGYHCIYVAFAWSVEEEAYKVVRELAEKHGVGFFDVSGNGDIIR